MAELKLTITTQSSAADVSDEAKKSETAKDTAKTLLTAAQGWRIAKQIGNEIIDASVSTIGTRTGNYTQQQTISQGISAAKRGIGVAMAFAANPLLGLIDLGVQGLSMGLQLAEEQRQIDINNRDVERLRQRSGYYSNGGR